jgi:hypothetical protein
LWVGELSTFIFPLGDDMLNNETQALNLSSEENDEDQVECLYLVTVAEVSQFNRASLSGLLSGLEQP